jgi:hypothetical protein
MSLESSFGGAQGAAQYHTKKWRMLPRILDDARSASNKNRDARRQKVHAKLGSSIPLFGRYAAFRWGGFRGMCSMPLKSGRYPPVVHP